MPESLGAFDPTTSDDEAVTEYEDASSEFWRYLSDHAVQLLGLQSGERVLVAVADMAGLDRPDVPFDAVLCILGIFAPAVEVVEPWSRVRTDDWWRIVMGSALRHTVSQLTPPVAEQVRARCNAEVARRQITALTTSSRYGLAPDTDPPPGSERVRPQGYRRNTSRGRRFRDPRAVTSR